MNDGIDLVRFSCQCGKKLKAHPGARGKIVKCPKCGKSVRVPQVSTRTKQGGLILSAAGVESAPSVDESKSRRAAGRPKAAPSKPGAAVEPQLPLSGGRCPKCGVPTTIGAVMCVNCGINFVTGELTKPRPADRKKR